MRLRGVRQSRNVQDRRRTRGGGARAGGIGGVGLLVVLAIGYFAGIDVSPLLQGAGSSNQVSTGQTRELSPAEQEAGVFVSQVLATTEDLWGQVFPEQIGRPYDPPQLVLCSEVTQSGCGGASLRSARLGRSESPTKSER